MTLVGHWSEWLWWWRSSYPVWFRIPVADGRWGWAGQASPCHLCLSVEDILGRSITVITFIWRASRGCDYVPAPLTSLSLPEMDSVSLVPAAALCSGVCGDSICGTATIVPSSETCDFSVSLSMPKESQPVFQSNSHNVPLSLPLLTQMSKATWHGHQTGLQSAGLSWHSWPWALHRHRLLRAGARNSIWRFPLPLQGLLNGGRVGGQVGQLMEDVALPNDGVHQITVTWLKHDQSRGQGS